MIRIIIPGPPKPQGRGRVITIAGHGAIADPKDSAEWKGRAAWLMKQECPQPLEGALAVSILAVFFCPASDYRKRHPQPRRWHTKATGDTDNIAKAVLDAGNSTLWLDDRQVAVLHVAKMIAAQGEPPFVEIEVRQLEEEPQ